MISRLPASISRFGQFALAATFMLTSAAPAQQRGGNGVSVQVSPPQIRPGGYANLSVMVEGGTAAEIQRPILPEGVELASPAKSTSSDTSIINGRVTRRYTQSWQITAEKPGDYIIPPQEVKVNGQLQKSNSIEFKVVEKSAAEYSPYEPLISIEAGKREFYVGEIVPITANLYIHRQTLLRRVGLIELPKDSFAIQRFPLQAEEGTTNIAGVPYRVLTYQSTMSALKPGKFKLGPASSEIIVELPSQDNPFPHPFLSQSEPQKMRPKSNDIDIEVVPLPEEGKPASFTGVVGDFEMNITAEPPVVAVGEPISVELTISGTGNFDAIVEPKMTAPQGWKIYPPRRFSMNSPDMFNGGTTQQIGFSQVIIPQQQVNSVPSYEFSFFSPTTKKYVTLRTPPVPLEVKPGLAAIPPLAEGGIADQARSSLVEPPPEQVPTAAPNMTDILAGTPESSLWLANRPPPWRDGKFVVTSAAAGGFLLSLLLGKLCLVLVRRSRNAPDAATRRLLKTMSKGGRSAAEFYRLAARYIQEKQLSGPEISGVLHKYDQYNFSRDHAAADAALEAGERAQVLKILRHSAEAS